MTENNFHLTSAAVSDRGLSEKRPQNEDSYLAIQQNGIFAVADGVGGAQAGDVASQMAMEILGEAFANLPESADAEDVMRIAIERANSAIFQMSKELPQLSTMATTVVALHINGNIATIGHVGDSRLYRLDGVGNLYRETEDHSVVAEEVRAGRMTAEQAENHPSRNIISRALGAEPSVDVDLKTIMIEPYTAFLICSDGITRHVDDGEIRDLLASGMEPAAICERLKELCYDRGAEDNLTAVIVDVASETSPRPALTDVAAPAAMYEGDEDTTVATARSPFDAPAEVSDEEDTDVISEPAQIIEPEPLTAAASAPANVYQEDRSFGTSSMYTEPPETTGSGAGKILGLVGMLLLGVLIGGGVMYSMRPEPVVQTVPAPQITEMKTNNPPLTAYEENRRNVDKNPGAYLSASGTEPQDAEDFYLRGRANMLTGKYWEAKRDFQEAKNRLAQADPMNSTVLATDIALAIAVINSGPAQEAFARDLSTAAAPNTSANANVAATPAPPAQ